MSGTINGFIMFGTGYEEGDRWMTSAAYLMELMCGLTWEPTRPRVGGDAHVRMKPSAMTPDSRAHMWGDEGLESAIMETLLIPFTTHGLPVASGPGNRHEGIRRLISFVRGNATAVRKMLPAMESAVHTAGTMGGGNSRLGSIRECCPGTGDDPRWGIAYLHYPVWLNGLDDIVIDKRRSFLEFACRHLIAAPVQCGDGWERVVTAAVTGYVSLPCFPPMPDDWNIPDPDMLKRMMTAGRGSGDGIGPDMAWAVPESMVMCLDRGPCDLPSMMLAHGPTDMDEAIRLSHGLAALIRRSTLCDPVDSAVPLSMGHGQVRTLLGMDRERAATVMECLNCTPDTDFRRDLVPEGCLGEDGVAYMVGFASRPADTPDTALMGRMFADVMDGRETVPLDGMRGITTALAASAWSKNDTGCAAAMAAAGLVRIIAGREDLPPVVTARAAEDALRFVAEGYPSGFVVETLKSGAA